MVSHRDRSPDTRAWAETATEFYRRERPDAHFRTSSSTSPHLADAVAALLGEHPEITTVVDVGAGTGLLLDGLRRRRPDLRLTGVDLRDRPTDLDPDVGWVVTRVSGEPQDETPPTEATGPGRIDGPALVLACELLDDVPLDPAGRTREHVWVALLHRLARHGGLALAVDYVIAGDQPAPLLAYRDGQPVDPVVAPDRNLSAPVDLDGVRRAGEAVGARTLALLPQAAALDRWRPTDPPTYDSLASPDPLADLVARSELYALTSPRWLGDHWWLLQQVPAPVLPPRSL